MATNLILRTLCMLVGLVATAGAEEIFTDPTRPAFELVPGIAAEGGATAGAVGKAETPPAGLQSVILARGHEAAIINGAEVALGQKYGDAVLTVVNETCVVLLGPQGRQVMHMFPTVQMSKSQRDCVKRPVLTAIAGPAAVKPVAPQGVARSGQTKKMKKARKARRAVVCAPEPSEDGSKK